MKRTLLFALLVGVCLFVLQTHPIGTGAQGAITVAGITDSLHATNAAIKAYPAAQVGHLLGSYIVMLWKTEVAKLMFWIHLFG
jgi:hypothetical protein